MGQVVVKNPTQADMWTATQDHTKTTLKVRRNPKEE